MSNLPFLKPHGWPKLRKLSGESRYGFDEDDDLVEDALNELMEAVEAKDHSKLMKAFKALIDCVEAREDNQNATDSQ